MSDEMKTGIVGAVVGAVITGIFSVSLFLAEQNSIEKKTVETLVGYFEEVNQGMTYEEALQTIYENSKIIKEENEELKSEIKNLEEKVSVEENNRKAIESSKIYASSSDYANALVILCDVPKRNAELEVLIKDYTEMYEIQIVEQVDKLKADEKLDEAIIILKEALDIIPDSEILKEKQLEIENSYPKNMLDVVSAYQTGGNPYKEYTSSQSGEIESFIMGGVKYTNGMTFNADINIFDDISWAVYNLSCKYKTLEFTVCHVDGTDIGKETSLQIICDGVLKEEIILAPDMSPKKVIVNVEGVTQLKMQVPSSGNDGPVYGVGNPVLKSY